MELILRFFDDAGSHRWESLTGVLENVAAEESRWRHPAYRSAEVEPGLPPPGTILWQIAHLAHCARHYAEILRRRPVTAEFETPPPAASDLPGLLSELERARAGFREAIRGLSDADLDQPCAHGRSVAEFLRMAIRHDSWHGGQIAVARRLYRERT